MGIPELTAFGSEIKRLRDELEMSQTALAEKAGLTQGAVAHLETGRTKTVGADVLYKLADALGVPCEHFRTFLTDDPPPARKKRRGK